MLTVSVGVDVHHAGLLRGGIPAAGDECAVGARRDRVDPAILAQVPGARDGCTNERDEAVKFVRQVANCEGLQYSVDISMTTCY